MGATRETLSTCGARPGAVARVPPAPLLSLAICMALTISASMRVVPGAEGVEDRLPPGGFPDVTWQDPCPGKWQTVDVSQKGITADAGDVTAKLQALVDGVSAPTVLSFPPGTYSFGKISIGKSNVILRGAGPKETTVKANKDGMVFAWNLNVDRVRDLAHSPDAPKECRDEKWINSKQRNGITNAFITADVAAHGNFPHTILFEGNIFYDACVDRSHKTNGPHFFFRNCALGQPPKYGWWQEGAGIVIMGPNDRQFVVGNVLRNDSVVLLQKHQDPRTSDGSLIAGNVVKGKADWGPLPADTKLPASLFRKDRPAYWPKELAWPAFGPDVPGAATAKIPAQLRYEREQKGGTK